jgi:L-ascorbate metabolism protein UlaG (beta-lactamase superfamily)
MGLLRTAALVAAFLSSLIFAAEPHRESLELTYLGNEGFLVRAGSQAVLFDALFGAGLPDYDHVPADVVRDMEAGWGLFEHVDIVFISHVHPDHFEARSTVRFMQSHPTTVVIGPTEVAAELKRPLGSNAPLLSQIRSIPFQPGHMATLTEHGIEIEIFPLAHGTVENLAYLVAIGGRKILHMGDADLPMNDIERFGLAERRIDVALVPYWQLIENAGRVRTGMNAKSIVAMHLLTHATAPESKQMLDHLGGVAGMVSKIHSEFPNAVVLKPLETKIF